MVRAGFVGQILTRVILALIVVLRRMLAQIGVNGLCFLCGHFNINAAQAVNDGCQAIKVDGNVIFDVQFKILVDGAHGKLTAAARIGGVDAVLVLVAGNGDIQVTQDAGQLNRAVVLVDGHDNLHVAILQAVLQRRRAGIHADEQDVDDVRGKVGVDVQLIGVNGVVDFVVRDFDGRAVVIKKYVAAKVVVIIEDNIAIIADGVVLTRG